MLCRSSAALRRVMFVHRGAFKVGVGGGFDHPLGFRGMKLSEGNLLCQLDVPGGTTTNCHRIREWMQ